MFAGPAINTGPSNVTMTVNMNNHASASIGMGVQAVASAGQKAFTKAEVATIRDTGQNTLSAGTVAMHTGNNADVGITAAGGNASAAEIVAGVTANVAVHTKAC